MKRNNQPMTGADAVDRYLASGIGQDDSGAPVSRQTGNRDDDEAVFARCDIAIALTPKIAGSVDVAWAFDEARELARTDPRQPPRPTPAGWFQRAGLAWGTAGALAVALVIALQSRLLEEAANSEMSAGTNAANQSTLTAPRATVANITFAPIVVSTELAQTLSEVRPVVMLGNQTPVDSRSMAVLPFTASANATVPRDSAISANSIYNQVYRQLSSIPGIYLIDPATAAVYAGSDLPAAEIAQQLGVRGIIEGNVDSIDGGIQFNLSLTDAASAGSSINQSIARPTAEAALLQSDIAASVLDALARTPPPDPPEQLL